MNTKWYQERNPN